MIFTVFDIGNELKEFARLQIMLSNSEVFVTMYVFSALIVECVNIKVLVHSKRVKKN